MDFRPYVLEALKHDSWQTGSEIAEVAGDKAIQNKDWGAMSFLFSIFSRKLAAGWLKFSAKSEVYSILYSLEREGLTRRRYRHQSADSVLLKHGLRQFEYQLRESGFRNRNKESFQLISQT